VSRLHRVAHPDRPIEKPREPRIPQGPYNADWERGMELSGVHMDGGHPVIRGEGVPVGRGLVCGCLTEEALRAWFSGWWLTLAQHGFRVYEYDVRPRNLHVGRSGQQATADVRHACLVKDRPIPKEWQ
jgi:hypothetical protein